MVEVPKDCNNKNHLELKHPAEYEESQKSFKEYFVIF